MLEVYGNLWEYPANARAITTNGFVKSNNECVMGRGCALEATKRYPSFSSVLGQRIKASGNSVHLFVFNNNNIITFPVKDKSEICKSDRSNVVTHMQNKFQSGQMVPGWACKARLDIISRSCKQLIDLANAHKYETVVLPRPGCGAGELDYYKDVRPILEQLDNRFHIITFK